MKWFRFYSDALDDPKVQLLPDAVFKVWVNLLALASKWDGTLPSEAECAFALRVDEVTFHETLQTLIQRGLLDVTETGMEPHNWQNRQRASDDVAARVRKHRQAEKPVTAGGTTTPTGAQTPRNVTGNNTDKIKREEIREEKKREENLAPQNAPRDVKPRPRNELFDSVLVSCGFDAEASLTAAEGAKIGRAVSQIKAAGGTPNDVALRALRYQDKYSNAPLTPLALASHWGELASEPLPRPPPNGNGRYMTAAEKSDDRILRFLKED